MTDDGYQRRGKVFTLRLSDEERQQLELLERAAQELLPWERRRSLGGFMVWAALTWKPPGETKPRNGRGADGTVYRNGLAVARRVRSTKRRDRAGNTGPSAKRKKRR